jgi:hypothetical protein
MWGRIRAHHGREGVLERVGTIPLWTLFRIGVETIAFTQPTVRIIKLGELPENAAIDEVIAAIQRACRRAGSECTIQVVRDLMPSHSGYPVRRTRYFRG